MVVPDEELVAEYYGYRQQLDQMAADFKDVITHPNYSLPFMQTGRLVRVKYKELDFGWGVIANYQKRLPPKARPFLPCGNVPSYSRLCYRRTPPLRTIRTSLRMSSTSSTLCFTAPRILPCQKTVM